MSYRRTRNQGPVPSRFDFRSFQRITDAFSRALSVRQRLIYVPDKDKHAEILIWSQSRLRNCCGKIVIRKHSSLGNVDALYSVVAVVFAPTYRVIKPILVVQNSLSYFVCPSCSIFDAPSATPNTSSQTSAF